MCLLVFAWQTDPDHPLIFAGNRDERHARAALAAQLWKDAPEVLGGRDLEAGGTWLGVTLGGRFAVVTNYREGLEPPKAARSRGTLTSDFLTGGMGPGDYLEAVRRHAAEYGAFSLLVGDRRELHYFSNRSDRCGPVAPGIHGLSNHLLDTPWPKVRLSKARLAALLEQATPTSGTLFRLLADRSPAPDDELPDTGIGRDLERRVSAPFVVNPIYGTRCSTVIHLQREGGLRFAERRFTPAGESVETRWFQAVDGAR
ncbi:MAG TPA: NRDE family protein [Gammaproteobacteria bacterium]|nr:NRDE family protein [Gammaproteobacteria bacterium]